MPSSAEISVVETFGSPKRLNSSSVTSRMRSAVRRGAFFAIVVSIVLLRTLTQRRLARWRGAGSLGRSRQPGWCSSRATAIKGVILAASQRLPIFFAEVARVGKPVPHLSARLGLSRNGLGHRLDRLLAFGGLRQEQNGQKSRRMVRFGVAPGVLLGEGGVR